MVSPELTKLSIDNAPTTPAKITTEGQAAAGRIAAARAAKNAGATTPQARQFAASTPQPTNTQTPITSESLKPTPQATLATTPQAVAVNGMMAEFEDSTDTFTKNLQEQAKAAEAPKESALDAYLGQLQGSKGVAGFTNDAYAVEGGVNDITPELNDINDKIRREQLALRRASEALQKKGGGLAGGAAAELQSLERESFAKQADLSVIQMAVQGRYDSAKEIADRAVSAQLEQQTNQLEVARFNYEENKELFTKAEQRAFEAEQGDRERALAAQAETLKAVKELGIQAQLDGAPTDVVQKMMAAKTEADAMAIGGQYIGALDREAKRASIDASVASAASSRQSASASRTNQLLALAEAGDQGAMAELGLSPRDPSEYEELDRKGAAAVQKEIVSNPNYEAVQKAQTSINALDAYIKVFEEVGTTSGVTSPFDNARLTKVHKAALLDLKEFFNLGVLNGPDLDILIDVLGDPTSQGVVTNPAAKSGAEEGIKQMRAKLSDTLDDRFLSVSSQYSNYNPADVPLIEDTQRVYLQTKAKLDPAVQKLIDENPDMQVSEVLQIINSKL